MAFDPEALWIIEQIYFRTLFTLFTLESNLKTIIKYILN